jgi:hypothetical protein
MVLLLLCVALVRMSQCPSPGQVQSRSHVRDDNGIKHNINICFTSMHKVGSNLGLHITLSLTFPPRLKLKRAAVAITEGFQFIPVLEQEAFEEGHVTSE